MCSSNSTLLIHTQIIYDQKFCAIFNIKYWQHFIHPLCYFLWNEYSHYLHEKCYFICWHNAKNIFRMNYEKTSQTFFSPQTPNQKFKIFFKKLKMSHLKIFATHTHTWRRLKSFMSVNVLWSKMYVCNFHKTPEKKIYT